LTSLLSIINTALSTFEEKYSLSTLTAPAEKESEQTASLKFSSLLKFLIFPSFELNEINSSPNV